MIAKLKSIAAAPTIAPAAPPLPGVPRLTAHHSAIQGTAALAQVDHAQLRPMATKSPSDISVRIGVMKSIAIPATVNTIANPLCHGADSRPGIAARKAIAATITAAPAKNAISSE